MNQLATTAASTGIHQGAESVASFGNTATEFETLTHGCALYDLSWRSKLVVTGDDRLRWLNGMVSNNVRDLPFEHGNRSFVLDEKGHILGDADIFLCGEYLLLATSAAQMPAIREHLEHFIIMDDVELTEVGGKLASIGVRGPEVRSLLSALGVPALDPGEIFNGSDGEMDFSVVRETEPAAQGYEFWIADEKAPLLWNRLAALGATPAGFEALEWLRIARGVPLYGLDLCDKDLAQESGQTHLLHFAKGCYIGQETVERVHSRGNVHRTLAGIIVEGEPPATGSSVLSGDKPVGTTGSAARIVFADGPRTLALSLLRRESAAPGNKVTINGVAATVAALPFEY